MLKKVKNKKKIQKQNREMNGKNNIKKKQKILGKKKRKKRGKQKKNKKDCTLEKNTATQPLQFMCKLNKIK